MTDPMAARIAELEAENARLRGELAGWKRAAMEAYIPLQAVRMMSLKLLGPTMHHHVTQAAEIVRKAAAGQGFPKARPANTIEEFSDE